MIGIQSSNVQDPRPLGSLSRLDARQPSLVESRRASFSLSQVSDFVDRAEERSCQWRQEHESSVFKKTDFPFARQYLVKHMADYENAESTWAVDYADERIQSVRVNGVVEADAEHRFYEDAG